MRIGGSERVGQFLGGGCAIAAATLVALAILSASSVIRGVSTYKFAIASGTLALLPAIAAALFCNDKPYCSASDRAKAWKILQRNSVDA
ncbi:MAG: hypothetical protein S4CHLAM81_10770 [Chlamydiales bacterium]|nr:hypothetical protein [Chlamydiales bacterium]MCH9635855.1 hypothetical protein [Chlamydiales bacterium]MCH9703571.1 hypothetical protein [Chlamydiota bacterium]